MYAADTVSRVLPAVAVVAADAALREAICFALEAEGYATRSFESGEAVLSSGGLNDVACCVIDDRAGVDAVRLIEDLEAAGERTSAVVLATRPDGQLRAACWRLGVPIVEKPILGDSLNACVRGLLARRRPREN